MQLLILSPPLKHMEGTTKHWLEQEAEAPPGGCKKRNKYAFLWKSIEFGRDNALLLHQCTRQKKSKNPKMDYFDYSLSRCGRQTWLINLIPNSCSALSTRASPRVMTAVVFHRWENICGKAAFLIGWKLCNHYLALQHNKHDSCAPRRGSTSAAAACAA